jgi:Na+-transporting NADH:ubiquinone oxidoreductase subunit NqrF
LSGLNKTNDCNNIHKIYGSILAVTVFIAILILLAAVILCTQKLKIDPQLCTCKKTKDEVEMKLIDSESNNDKRIVTVAWEKKDSSNT